MTLFQWELIGALFVSVSGSLLHFVYCWSGKQRVVAFFSPINESTWEHLKLLFFPSLLFSFLEYGFIGRSVPGFFTAKCLGILAGMFFIVGTFYLYTGIIGHHFLAADICVFLIGVEASHFFALREFLNPRTLPSSFGIAALIFLLGLFVVFTVHPPQIALFSDPQSK